MKFLCQWLLITAKASYFIPFNCEIISCEKIILFPLALRQLEAVIKKNIAERVKKKRTFRRISSPWMNLNEVGFLLARHLIVSINIKAACTSTAHTPHECTKNILISSRQLSEHDSLWMSFYRTDLLPILRCLDIHPKKMLFLDIFIRKLEFLHKVSAFLRH